MWGIGFATHLPAVRLPQAVAGPVLLGTMLIVICWRIRRLGGGLITGLLAGLMAAAANLFALGSYLGSDGVERGARPDAWILALGFVGLSVVIGGVGGAIAGRKPRSITPGDWLSDLTLVAALSIAPLLLIGGLVTSTESGMAVPDWPTTYGGNMFLYPIGLMADERIFLEHTHRLFGMFAGFCVFVLAIAWTGRMRGIVAKISCWLLLIGLAGGYFDSVFAEILNFGDQTFQVHRYIGGLAIPGALLALFCGARPATATALLLVLAAQGILGGLRVTENNLWLATVHGIAAQLLFMGAMMFAGAVRPIDGDSGVITDESRPPVRFAKVALIILFIQLVLGAMYRHLGVTHALWAHIGWSFIAATAVLGLGFACRKADRQAPGGRALRRIGMGLIHAVILQFLLGWAAFWLVLNADDRGQIPSADQLETAQAVPLIETLTTTLHQANGALVLSLAGLALVWAVRANRAWKSAGNA